jgi:hypothetical protein
MQGAQAWQAPGQKVRRSPSELLDAATRTLLDNASDCLLLLLGGAMPGRAIGRSASMATVSQIEYQMLQRAELL